MGNSLEPEEISARERHWRLTTVAFGLAVLALAALIILAAVFAYELLIDNSR